MKAKTTIGSIILVGTIGTAGAYALLSKAGGIERGRAYDKQVGSSVTAYQDHRTHPFVKSGCYLVFRDFENNTGKGIDRYGVACPHEGDGEYREARIEDAPAQVAAVATTVEADWLVQEQARLDKTFGKGAFKAGSPDTSKN